MPQSLANVLVHIVFSTKERRALLQNRDLRDEMHRYITGISANLECPAIIVGGAGPISQGSRSSGNPDSMKEWAIIRKPFGLKTTTDCWKSKIHN